MKFEEKIKQKYLYSSGFGLIKKLKFFFQKLKSKIPIKKSHSSGGQPIIIHQFF